MAHPLSLIPAQPDPPALRTGLVWRSDLDPDALPPTDDLTAGQRRVLIACLELFATNGFEGSSTRDIAAKARMQSPSLYNHFPSKEAMLSTLVLLGHEHHHRRLLNAVLGAGATPTAQLAALTRAHVLDHFEYARLGMVSNVQMSHLSADAFSRVQMFREEGSALLHEILRRGVEAGEFYVPNAQILGGAIASMGVAVAPLFPYSEGLAAEDLADHYAGFALRMAGVCDHDTASPTSDPSSDGTATA